MIDLEAYRPSIPHPASISLPPEKTLLVIVDMQNDYCRRTSPAFVGETILGTIDGIRRILKQARQHGVRVVFTESQCALDDPEILEHPRIRAMSAEHVTGAIRGTPGAKTIDELAPMAGEVVIEKGSADPWFGTPLEDLIRQIHFGHFEAGSVFRNRVLNDCNVIVTGTESDWCVDKAVIGFYLRGYQVVIPVDCISAPTAFRQDSALHRFATQYLGHLTRSDLLQFDEMGLAP